MNKDYEYAIDVENATVLLGGNEILHNISWQVKKGARYFILGANGAGKTTLVRTILGYIWPLYGAKVEVLGKRYGKTNLNTLRKSIAWVSPFLQKKMPEYSSGLDMVLSGPEGFLGFSGNASSEETQKARTLLKELRGEHLGDKNINDMSSGEQMKILIARALLTEPELVILDEPTVYLDIAEREYFLNAVNKLSETHPDLTMIFISQRIEDILPIFTLGMIMKSGKIEACGKKQDVLTEQNIEKTFGIKTKLIKANSGRLWTIID
ncbi:MAG: ATP-binding cassette domain-containing protein [Candidatus Gastranaerophilales bacterium]|nr:ATP-binding cassette domain-containing protein [Candidatus Gastranaerophilales bacterium]